MIAEKTKGNLTLDEQRLIENSLTELRFRFVQVSESHSEASRVMPEVNITVLGSGTSMGVPTLGCSCAVCHSDDPRDNRLRPSIMLQYHGRTVLIDTTPDFRQQALRERIARIDAILFTHSHADHIMGLDDVRPLNLRQKQEIPVYGSAETLRHDPGTSFRYIFENSNPESTIPKLSIHPLPSEGVELFGLHFTPILLAPRPLASCMAICSARLPI